MVAAGGEVRQADDGGWRIKRKSPHVDRNMPDPFARVSAMVSVSRALGDRRLKVLQLSSHAQRAEWSNHNKRKAEQCKQTELSNWE